MRSPTVIRYPKFAPLIAGFSLVVGVIGCTRPPDEAEFIAQAKTSQQKGDSKSAIIQLKNALQLNARNIEARYGLALLYLQNADPASAESEIRKAQELGLARNRALPVLANALLAQGTFQKVLNETEPIAASAPNAELLTFRAKAFLGLKRFPEAKAALVQALEIDPRHAPAFGAMARYSIANRDVKSARAYADKAIALSPQDSDLLVLKAGVERANGNETAAMIALDQAIKFGPRNFNAYVDRSALLISQKKFADAKKDIEQARALQPTGIQVQFVQASLDYSEGKNAAALDAIQQVLRVAPEDPQSLLLAASIQAALGSTEQAEQHLKKYLTIEPDNLYASKLLASVYLKTGQPDKASALLAGHVKDSTRDAHLLMLEGESLLQRNQAGKATAIFERAKTLAPDAAIVHTALAMSSLKQGDSAKGIAELETAANLDKGSDKSGLTLILTHLQLQQFDKALEVAKKLEARNPNDAQVLNLEGGAYVGLKDFANARLAFQKAIKAAPEFFPATENLARLDLLEKHPDDAAKRFKDYLLIQKKSFLAMSALADLAIQAGHTAEATQWLEKAVAENPDSIPAQTRLGRHYLQTGAKAKALQLAQKLVGTHSGDAAVLELLGRSQLANDDKAGALTTFQKIAASQPASAQAQYQLAQVQVEAGDESSAIAAINKARTLDPANLQAAVLLSTIQMKRADYASATKTAREIEKLRPDLPLGFVIEGEVLMAQKMPKQAVKLYEKAFTIAKSDAVMIKLHEALTASGSDKEAETKMQQWLNDNPGDLRARLYLGGFYLARQQVKPAIQQFEAAQKLAPDNEVVLNNLAYAYQEQGDPRATGLAERALKISPESPLIMDTAGWIFVKNGNSARGIALLEKARSMNPQNTETRMHLATAYVKTGDKVKARKELEPMLGAKDPALVRDAKKLLSEL